MAVLDNCCFCWSLKTGCFIIGYLYLATYILSTLAVIGVFIFLGIKISSVPNEDYYDPQHHIAYDVGVGTLLGVGLVLIVLMSIFLTISIVFVVGLHKGKRGHVKAFMVFMIIGVVLGVIGSMGSLLSLQPESIVSNLLGLAWQVYIMLVVKSYYETMGAVNPPVTYKGSEKSYA